MKVIDLLNIIAKDKLSDKSKIIFGDEVYTYNRDMKLLIRKGHYKAFYGFQLNDLVEIVKSDDETEIIEEKPKKIDDLDFKYINSYGNISQHKASEKDIILKIHELTKAVNYLLEKGDKDE